MNVMTWIWIAKISFDIEIKRNRLAANIFVSDFLGLLFEFVVLKLSTQIWGKYGTISNFYGELLN